jgi:hypothetical protein
LQFCKENHFCPGGAVNASTVCPDGKYSLPGSDDAGDCNCPNSSTSRQNSRYVSECICDSGYYKEYSGLYPLGGWYCRLCQVGEFCFNNTNRTCPVHSTSFGVARSYQDCFCNPGYKNVTARTEEAFCEDCPANYYCTGKGSVQACVANALSPSQSQDYTRCYCNLGWKGVNNTACVACQSPTYCYGGVQAQCSEGTYSPALAFDRLNCSCIAGRWGPTGMRVRLREGLVYFTSQKRARLFRLKLLKLLHAPLQTVQPLTPHSPGLHRVVSVELSKCGLDQLRPCLRSPSLWRHLDEKFGDFGEAYRNLLKYSEH